MRKVNITVEVKDGKEQLELEKIISSRWRITSLRVLQDYSNLIKENDNFKKLIDEKKRIQLLIDRFINETL